MEQLTYASVAQLPGANRGGWGVIERTPGLPPSDDAALLRAISTRIAEDPPLPLYPSDADLERRTRRLRYLFTEHGLTFWHAVAAGPDSSGRPGNVFNHIAALDPGLDIAVRPSAYWRSPDWLEPYGPQATTAARIGREVRPGPLADSAALHEWLAVSNRTSVLPWFLDAIQHCWQTNRIAMLVTENADETAHWIALANLFTAASLGRRLSWTTFEDKLSLNWACESGFRIIGVNRGQVHEMTFPGHLLVLDTEWDLDGLDAEATGRWRFQTGTEVRVSAWSSAALDLLGLFAAGPTYVDRVVAQCDEIGSRLPADPSTALFWPLLMALRVTNVSAGTGRDHLLTTLLRTAPDGSPVELVEPLLADWRQANPDPGALAELAASSPMVSGLLVRREFESYLAGVAADPAVLESAVAPSSPSPLPGWLARSMEQLRDNAIAVVLRGVDEALPTAGGADATAVRRAASFADTLLGTGLADRAGVDRLVVRIQAAVDQYPDCLAGLALAELSPLLTVSAPTGRDGTGSVWGDDVDDTDDEGGPVLLSGYHSGQRIRLESAAVQPVSFSKQPARIDGGEQLRSRLALALESPERCVQWRAGMAEVMLRTDSLIGRFGSLRVEHLPDARSTTGARTTVIAAHYLLGLVAGRRHAVLTVLESCLVVLSRLAEQESGTSSVGAARPDLAASLRRHVVAELVRHRVSRNPTQIPEQLWQGIQDTVATVDQVTLHAVAAEGAAQSALRQAVAQVGEPGAGRLDLFAMPIADGRRFGDALAELLAARADDPTRHTGQGRI